MTDKFTYKILFNLINDIEKKVKKYNIDEIAITFLVDFKKEKIPFVEDINNHTHIKKYVPSHEVAPEDKLEEFIENLKTTLLQVQDEQIKSNMRGNETRANDLTQLTDYLNRLITTCENQIESNERPTIKPPG